MIKHHPDMGDPLYMLAEECSEVIQAIMKYKRFSGKTNRLANKDDETLRTQIVQEIADVLAVVEMLEGGAGAFEISDAMLRAAMARKAQKLSAIFGVD